MDKLPESELLQLPATGFMRAAQVLKFIPVGKTCWWVGVKTGRFPKPVKFGRRCTMWRAEDIHALIRELTSKGQ